ncbi:M23 family metallopeptidase [Flavobacterium silvisoli]|uniref:M23 family metallopeptidase n=2 Tax=Flavobacterium silvisoli TaxID=2529433 RepID=A0A4Q9Z4Y5_9FLAO|nr:M23 family metallopeptidase [Flavobacterium silvisoli]
MPLTVDFGFKLNDYNIVEDTIQSGDTFGSILEKQNLNGNQVYDIVAKVKDTFDVRSIRKGKPFLLLRTKDKTNKLQAFIYQPDRLNYYIVDLRDSVVAHKRTRPVKFVTKTIAGALNGSLSETLQNLKVDPALAPKIAKIYAWSIDFFKLQKGDKFAMTFTERFINDTIYDGVDSLKATYFEYKGKKIYAFPFSPDGSTGKQQYFDEEGKTLKNFFLKAPLKFVNITSRYTKSRFHPVQKIWKAHNGTDYAAPTGTPIMTTASGVVEQAGYTAGNGNFVKVKHDRTYSTQYLHMSKILVRRGQRVTQGQIIGKVGSTGLATGPHVCYRFWKNGVQVDALRLNLPTSTPMDSKLKPKFMEQMLPLKKVLDSVSDVKFRK